MSLVTVIVLLDAVLAVALVAGAIAELTGRLRRSPGTVSGTLGLLIVMTQTSLSMIATNHDWSPHQQRMIFVIGWIAMPVGVALGLAAAFLRFRARRERGFSGGR
ncbi:MAG: hypothetical protein ACYCVZ_00820 [Streptosporangiaceae bacterium]